MSTLLSKDPLVFCSVRVSTKFQVSVEMFAKSTRQYWIWDLKNAPLCDFLTLPLEMCQAAAKDGYGAVLAVLIESKLAGLFSLSQSGNLISVAAPKWAIPGRYKRESASIGIAASR